MCLEGDAEGRQRAAAFSFTGAASVASSFITFGSIADVCKHTFS